ncbi:hypothetical protein PPYR_05264 [Photinus pyralis]|uniref:Large ribosomal subunit protein bL32m n=1 Tax=Photinus pyralis TaxID=7054 RepID=A0A1Y1MWZ2_PHOPY|nr:39S ribosomal protein L32, mitochondrial [Photinus pyralis]KAB0800910.1 hypothetical protein PPYR_05264 [Photinus pyralis]
MAFLLHHLRTLVQNLENTVANLIIRRRPPAALCFDLGVCSSQPLSSSLKDILNEGFLWAVPRNRRTIEKRLKRQYGDPYYISKLLVPKKTLRACNVCGDDHEIGILCPTCYKKVIEETRAMQDAIQNELGLKVVENEVVVLYNGEKNSTPSEYFEGKRIVEIDKPRPAWFSKNLLQSTTQQPATSTNIKPSDLG